MSARVSRKLRSVSNALVQATLGVGSVNFWSFTVAWRRGGGATPAGTPKGHQQEHRPQRPTERSDPTQHAKGRTGDCPGPRKETTTRRNATRGLKHARPELIGWPACGILYSGRMLRWHASRPAFSKAQSRKQGMLQVLCLLSSLCHLEPKARSKKCDNWTLGSSAAVKLILDLGSTGFAPDYPMQRRHLVPPTEPVPEALGWLC